MEVKRTEVSLVKEKTPEFFRAYVKYCTTEPLSVREIENIKSAFEGDVVIERKGNQVCILIEKLKVMPIKD